MALVTSNQSLLPLSIIRSSKPILHSYQSQRKFKILKTIISSKTSVANQMNQQGDGRPKFKDFLYATAPIRDLMMELVSTVESRLMNQLLPCALPEDVQHFQDENGTNHGSLYLLSGAPSSPIDFILGSWLYCKLPTGQALRITSLVSYMNDSTDSPQLLIEFIQSSPASVVILLDLPARRDLVSHPDYLKTFYEDTDLEKQRQHLHKVPEAHPYISPSLYIRSILSPTAIAVYVDASEKGEHRLEEILRDEVSNAAKVILDTWLDKCLYLNTQTTENIDRAHLKRRDETFRSKTIEIDIGSNLPRLFGKEIADRVLFELKNRLTRS